MFSMIHRPAHQNRQLQADQRDHRNEGVLHGVPNHDDLFAQSLRPGGPDVVLAQHLQHHGACHAHGARRPGGAEDRAGDEEHGQVAEWIVEEADVHQRRRPAPPDGRVGNHHQRQPEVGGRHADHRERASGVVGAGVLANRGVDPDRQADAEADQNRQDTQLHGQRQAFENGLLDRRAAEQRLAEGAAQQDTADPAPILHPHRYIQAERPLQGGAVQVALHHPPTLIDDLVDRVAGDEPDRQEHQDRQDEQRGDGNEDAPDGVRGHGNLLLPGGGVQVREPPGGWPTQAATPTLRGRTAWRVDVALLIGPATALFPPSARRRSRGGPVSDGCPCGSGRSRR